MNQSDIIKGLLTNYINEGGDINDLEAAAAYCEQFKPAGSGRVNPVIAGAIFRLMGYRPTTPASAMTPEIPPAVVEPAATVIAAKTVTLPSAMSEQPVTVFQEVVVEPDFGEPPMPPMPVPAPAPEKQTDPAEPAPKAESPKPSWLNKLKFWKKK